VIINNGSSEQELIICVPLTCGPSVGYVTEFGLVYCEKARDSPEVGYCILEALG
jgi:hypothetical protein